MESEAVEAPSWIKIGEHANRDVLKEMAKKIRAKWVGRYEFQICPLRDGRGGYELQLKHR